MSEDSKLNRRRFLGTGAATTAATQLGKRAGAQPTRERPTKDAIYPFRVDFPDEQLTDLRQRVQATRWPERETVADASQGAQLATAQKLASYCVKECDRRKCETTPNALPNFLTEIDRLEIQFIHVRSEHENALSLNVTHGWPGAVIEQMKIIDPLTDPTAHGGKPADAFHLVILSMPCYGFSGKPTTTGWGPVRIARACVVLQPKLFAEEPRTAFRSLR